MTQSRSVGYIHVTYGIVLLIVVVLYHFAPDMAKVFAIFTAGGGIGRGLLKLTN